MKPPDDLLATLLALPLEARQALTKAEGPGWHVRQHGRPGAQPHTHFAWSNLTESTAWLPASECEVMRLWAEHLGEGWIWAIDSTDVMIGPEDRNSFCEKHDGTYWSRLHAALRCCPVQG